MEKEIVEIIEKENLKSKKIHIPVFSEGNYLLKIVYEKLNEKQNKKYLEDLTRDFLIEEYIYTYNGDVITDKKELVKRLIKDYLLVRFKFTKTEI